MTQPKRRNSKAGMAERREFGQRLKRAAQAVGFTSETLAERLGVTPGAVRNWWVGKNEPARETMSEYARLTKVSMAYLLQGQCQAMGPTGTLQEWRLRFAELIRQGVAPLEAIDRITGTDRVGSPAIPDDRLTPEERELLAGDATAMQAALDRASGGRWDRLTSDQKEAVLRLIQTMLPPGEDVPEG